MGELAPPCSISAPPAEQPWGPTFNRNIPRAVALVLPRTVVSVDPVVHRNLQHVSDQRVMRDRDSLNHKGRQHNTGRTILCGSSKYLRSPSRARREAQERELRAPLPRRELALGVPRLVVQPIGKKGADGLVLLENITRRTLDVEQYDALGRKAGRARGFLCDRQGVGVRDEEGRFGFLELVEEFVGGEVGVCASWVGKVS